MSSLECLESLKLKNDRRLKYFQAALKVAEEAGTIISKSYYDAKNVSNKACATDLVTETDQQIEKLIFDTLRKQFPTHKFIGEESVSDGASAKLTSEPTWIVDPIDGTTNFVHRNPYVAVCIGLVIDKKSEVAVVYAPVLKDMYTAVRGEGAYLNGRRLHIENPPQCLSSALVATEWGASRDSYLLQTKSKNMLDVIQKHQVRGVRCTGSAALNMCMVAARSVDIYFEWGPHSWDVAAASLMVEEAGGVNSTTTGGPFDHMCCTIISAACRSLIDEIVPTLTQIQVTRDDE